MRRMTTYILTVSYYPSAIENNGTPDDIHSYINSCSPGHHRTEKFTFLHAPTLDDFKQVISAQTSNEKLIPLLDVNQWPWIEPGKNSARTRLFVQDSGVNKLVGHLEVSKDEAWY